MKGSVLEKWPNQDPIGEAGGLNLYGYVGNNPVNFVDPLGLLVELYSHPAGGGYSHAYLKITPDNPAAFPEIPMQTDQNGNKFFTLGGHPGWFDEYLNGELNNKSDVDSSKNGGNDLGPITRSKCNDTLLISQLLSSYYNYNNNGSLYYSAYAGGQLYNSNGYASGIIDSVGAQGPDMSSKTTFMGWDNPVPPTAFTAK